MSAGMEMVVKTARGPDQFGKSTSHDALASFVKIKTVVDRQQSELPPQPN